MNHLETRHRSEIPMPVAQSKHNPWHNLHRATVSRGRSYSFRRLSLIMTAHYHSTCWVNIDKGVAHAIEMYLHPAFPLGKLLYSEFSLLFFFPSVFPTPFSSKMIAVGVALQVQESVC